MYVDERLVRAIQEQRRREADQARLVRDAQTARNDNRRRAARPGAEADHSGWLTRARSVVSLFHRRVGAARP